MQNFVAALVEGLSADALWGAISPMAPLIIVLVLTSLGFYVARKNLKRGAKGKGGTI